MEIGIFAQTFARPSLTVTPDGVLASGLRVIQSKPTAFRLRCGQPCLVVQRH